MFEISFGKLIVIGVVILLVLGPEKAKELVKQAGFYWGKFQKIIVDFKNSIDFDENVIALKKVHSDLSLVDRKLKENITLSDLDVEKEMDVSQMSHNEMKQLLIQSSVYERKKIVGYKPSKLTISPLGKTRHSKNLKKRKSRLY